jgi:hypothetical protein
MSEAILTNQSEEVDRILSDGKAEVRPLAPEERRNGLLAMRRGAESQINILRLRFEVADAIGAQPVKDEVRKEAEVQVRAIKYIDGELAKLRDNGSASK